MCDIRNMLKSFRLVVLISAFLVFGQLLLLLIAQSHVLNDVALVYLLRAFPAFFSLLLAVLALLIVGVCTVMAWRKQYSRAKVWRLQLAPLGALIFSLICSFAYGLPNETTLTTALPAPKPGQLRILSWNTDDVVKLEVLLKQALAVKPDIIVYPEMNQYPAKTTKCPNPLPADAPDVPDYPWICKVAVALDMNVYYPPQANESTLLVKKSLGEYRVSFSEQNASAGFIATPLDAKTGSPTIFAVHLQRPELGGYGMRVWAQNIAWAKENCKHANMIVAGDFNTSLRNLGGATFGNCRDAAAALGIASAGTWPAFLPAALGTDIDHIFIGSVYKTVYYTVLSDSDGSGHRPIFAIIEKQSR